MADNPIFSYTRRDYERSRQEGIAKIPVLSKGTWTDLNATDPGVIILDYVHALVDMINYYQDHQALETFLTTAKERANIFRIAKQLSYDIRSAKGAVCDVTFTSSLTYDHPIKIPKYTSVSTRDSISYLTTEDAYLPTRGSQVTVHCSQGKLKQREYVGTGISRFSTETSPANQIVNLSDTTIDIDTITVVETNTGTVWTPVDYIIFSTSTDKVYEVDLNPDNTVSIKFGDGERGVVPDITDVFTIYYVITDEDKGRVGANTIILLDNQISDGGKYVELTVNNNQASTGGSAAQSSEEIRALAPGSIKAQDRAVTLSDFENLSKLVSGVSDAKAYDINIDSDIPYYEVRVLIIPDSLEEVSEEEREDYLRALRTTVLNYLSKKVIPPTNIRVTTPQSIPIDINMIVKKLDTAIKEEVEYEVREAITTYFSSRSSAVGEPFYPDDLRATISKIPTVRSIVSSTPDDIVEMPNLYSVATLGTLYCEVQ